MKLGAIFLKVVDIFKHVLIFQEGEGKPICVYKQFIGWQAEILTVASLPQDDMYGDYSD